VNPRLLLHWFRRLIVWLIPPALLVVIWGELTSSRVASVLETRFWDKSLHFTAYFGLSLMVTIAVRANHRAIWWALGLIMLGGALEIVQGMTGRDADIFDELANSLGVVTGLAIGWASIAILKAYKLVEGDRAD
jgi:VanZ family protein